MSRVQADDIAVVTTGENAGQLVHVLYPSPSSLSFWMTLHYPHLGSLWWHCKALGHIKTLQFNLAGWSPAEAPPGRCVDCPDCQLRPLRDGPGTDETLDWASAPDPQVARLLKLLHEARA